MNVWVNVRPMALAASVWPLGMASTLLSIIGIGELLLATQEVISRTFLSLPFYFLAGALYITINYGIERFGRFVEHKMSIQP